MTVWIKNSHRYDYAHTLKQIQSCIYVGLLTYIFSMYSNYSGAHAIGKGEPAKTASMASSMERPCLRIVER